MTRRPPLTSKPGWDGRAKPGIIEDWRSGRVKVLGWTAAVIASCFLWLCIFAIVFGLGDTPS